MWCHGPRALIQARLALCGVGPHWRKGHLPCCPTPTSCFLYYPDTGVEKREQEGEKGLPAGYQRWLFSVSSSFLKTFSILCSVLHETKLGLGQEWAESLESSVGRNLVTTPNTFPTPRIIFSSILVPILYPQRPWARARYSFLSVPSLTLPYP